jgi:hypothetical protein
MTFEQLLSEVCGSLTSEAQKKPFANSEEFENRVRSVILEIAPVYEGTITFDPHPYAFPDIRINNVGIEVKFTSNDTWRSVGNSVFESTRDQGVSEIYLVFGKMGGLPEVKWQKYEDSIIHVRTSHVPRFEVEIGNSRSLFSQFGLDYAQFKDLEMHEKMTYIRNYARNRLKPNERLWWLEDRPNSEHTLPLVIKFYTELTKKEKEKYRAESSLLSPKIFKSGRDRTKYFDVAAFLFTYYGIIAYQVRDLFTAGSVGDKKNVRPGKGLIQAATLDIQDRISEAALYLDSALFTEYWKFDVEPSLRIIYWLKLVESYCDDNWKPSKELFNGRYENQVNEISLEKFLPSMPRLRNMIKREKK